MEQLYDDIRLYKVYILILYKGLYLLLLSPYVALVISFLSYFYYSLYFSIS